jgi:ferric-dicitrate binding protein FerR (iron transport regulator)
MKENNIDRQFRERVDQMSDLPQNISWNRDSGWIQYLEQFDKEKPEIRKIVFTLLAAAAVLVIVVFTVFLNNYFKDKSVTQQNLTSEVRQIILPGGNKAWLNSNSSIEYRSAVNSGNFEIEVSGEIYLEINNLKYERYTLKAYNAIIVAENPSSINIKAYPEKENIDIAVKTGAVKVYEEASRKGMALLVTQGNYCSVHKSQKLIYVSANNNDNYLAWKTGKLIFEDQSVATIVDILSEYYNRTIEISTESVAYCTFSGSFENPAIENILNKIQKDLNLRITYTGSKITISGTGCL